MNKEATNSAPEKKPEVKDSSFIKGSIDSKYKLAKEESDLVHCVLIDHASPRSKDLTKEHKPHTRILKTSPQNFVNMFACNFEENETMQNVSTPGRIAAILNNLNEGIIAEVYADDIQSSTKGSPKLKSNWIARKLDEKSRLKVSGGNQMVNKGGILHIPDMDGFPFDPKELKEFPKDCLY